MHFFMPGSVSDSRKLARKGMKTKVVQTLISVPENSEDFKSLIFGDHVVTFCETDQQTIQKELPNAPVDVIPPCAAQPLATTLRSPAEVRSKYNVDDRLLVVALTDFSDHSHFSAFLYTAREYQRKEGFRFLLPLYKEDKESLRWRDSLRKIVDQENLTRTSFVDHSEDYHSLIDSSDFCLSISKTRNHSFEFPLNVVEALCAGKPVICYNTAPVNEFIAAFRKDWIANTNEDYSRISRDLLKQSSQLEQVSTELARFARAKLSVETVASRYQELYKSLLSL